jgi:hypothetical protein
LLFNSGESEAPREYRPQFLLETRPVPVYEL